MFHQFSPENRASYEMMWKNIVERGQAAGGNIIGRMRFAR